MRILASIFISAFLLTSFSTRAQISIGIKGGVDLSRLVNAVEGNNGSSISTLSSGTVTQFYGELFVDIPLDSASKMFYLRPGIEYIGAGGSMNPTGNYTNPNGFMPSTKYTLHYVDVPLEFVYSPGFSWGRPIAGVGLYAGALVNGTMKTTGGSSESVMIGSKASDNFQRVDFGYCFSVGLAIKAGFTFGIDYQHSFLQVVPNSSVQNGLARLHTHNSVWGFHLGWIFKL